MTTETNDWQEQVGEILQGFLSLEESNDRIHRLVDQRFDGLTEWIRQLEARVDALTVIASRGE